MTNLTVIRFCILIRLSSLLLPKDYLTIYKLLFAKEKTPNLRTLILKLCIETRLKTTLKENDNEDELLIYFQYDPSLATLPRFESDLISVYQEKEDRKYNLLNQNKSFRLIGTNTVRLLSPPELMYLRTQLENYIERKKPLGEIDLQ